MASTKIVGEVNTVSLKFNWQIGIDEIRNCERVGERLLSPKFAVNKSHILWQLSLYPNGQTEKSKDFVSLYLKANVSIRGHAVFIILDNSGEIAHKSIINKCLFGQNGRGIPHLLSREFFIDSPNGLLINDKKITIQCEIMYDQNYGNNQEIENQEEIATTRIEKEYQALLEDGKFSDVSLISEGKTMKLHKCILAKRSAVFAAMFDCDMKEKQENVVKIVDIKYEVLRQLMHFIYTGKVNNIGRYLVEVATAADKYALNELVSICEQRIMGNMNLHNVIKCLHLADRLRMSKLKEKAVDLIVENANDISDKPEFNLLPEDIVRTAFCRLAKRRKI